MSIRYDVIIDWSISPRIITIAKDGAASEAISLQDLVDTLRYLEYQTGTMGYDYIIDSYGKQALGGNTYVGITLVLKDAKLAFEARDGPAFTQCNISGGNLVAIDANGDDMDPVQTTAYTQVVRTSSSSATLQELLDIQYSSFNGGITIDATSSYTGTTYPTGTARQPVNNLSDAMTIATERGFPTLYIVGDLTIDTSGDYNGMIFIGESMTRSTLTISSGANVANCEFENAEIAGTLDGNTRLHQCMIGDLNYIYGVIESCILTEGTIVLGGGNAAYFLDCWSGVPGTNTPIIDMGGSGQALNLRNYNGGIKLTNKSGSDAVSIDLNSGQVILDSTVINGEIVIRGVGKLTDNNNGATIDNEYLLQGDDLVTTKKMTFNKAIKSGDIVTIYEDDGETIWKQFSLANESRVEQ